MSYSHTKVSPFSIRFPELRGCLRSSEMEGQRDTAPETAPKIETSLSLFCNFAVLTRWAVEVLYHVLS
jgi:hypothetical protein